MTTTTTSTTHSRDRASGTRCRPAEPTARVGRHCIRRLLRWKRRCQLTAEEWRVGSHVDRELHVENKNQHIVTAALLVAAALALMTFLTALWHRIAPGARGRRSARCRSSPPVPVPRRWPSVASYGRRGRDHHASQDPASPISTAVERSRIRARCPRGDACDRAERRCLSVMGRRASVLLGPGNVRHRRGDCSARRLAFVPIALLLIWVLIVSATTWLRSAADRRGVGAHRRRADDGLESGFIPRCMLAARRSPHCPPPRVGNTTAKSR